MTTEGIPVFGGYFPQWRLAIRAAHLAHGRDATQAIAQQGAVLATLRAAGARGMTPGEIGQRRGLRRASVDTALAALAMAGLIAVSDNAPRRAHSLAALERPLVAVASEGCDG